MRYVVTQPLKKLRHQEQERLSSYKTLKELFRRPNLTLKVFSAKKASAVTNLNHPIGRQNQVASGTTSSIKIRRISQLNLFLPKSSCSPALLHRRAPKKWEIKCKLVRFLISPLVNISYLLSARLQMRNQMMISKESSIFTMARNMWVTKKIYELTGKGHFR